MCIRDRNYTPQIVTILHINVRGSIESIAFVPREEKRAHFFVGKWKNKKERNKASSSPIMTVVVCQSLAAVVLVSEIY